MAVSGKTADLEWPYYLGTDKPPDMAAVTKAQADRAEALLTGASSQLLIVQDTGAPAAKAMSGDISISKAGVTQIGNNKLATGMYQDGSVTPVKLSSAARPVTWYAPKIIAAEESRTNTAFGTLTTADEIKEVVLPENGLIVVAYQAIWKESVAGAASSAIFLGANQLKYSPGDGEPIVSATGVNDASNPNVYKSLASFGHGLSSGGLAGTAYPGDVTTGQVIGVGTSNGPCYIFAAAGTYSVSIQFKSSSGSITAKNRKLWVWVQG
jgi:hypothetical protein